MEQNIIDRAEGIVKDVIAKYKLTWNFDSIEFVLGEGESFDKLANYDGYLKSLRLLIQCGLNTRDKKTANKIMDELRENEVSPRLAHFCLVEVLKTKHFFSDTSEIVAMETEKAKRITKGLTLNSSGNATEKEEY